MHPLGGRELTYESLLTRANINYHVGHYLNDKSDNVRGASRGVLEALARALNPDWDEDDGKRRFGDSTAVALYTPEELAVVRRFPESQTNSDRVDKARVLLGLTLGAGLRTPRSRGCAIATFARSATRCASTRPAIAGLPCARCR